MRYAGWSSWPLAVAKMAAFLFVAYVFASAFRCDATFQWTFVLRAGRGLKARDSSSLDSAMCLLCLDNSGHKARRGCAAPAAQKLSRQ